MTVTAETTARAETEERFEHPALFYADAEAYLGGTVPFIDEGLVAGDPVAVAVTTPNLQMLRSALGSAAQRVWMVDMTQSGVNPGRIIPGVLRAFADAHPDRHVRIIGEPIWPGRTELEYPACAQHEALINLAFTGRDVTILCPYNSTALHPRVIADALATHPVLLGHTGYHTSDHYDPHRIIARYNQPLPPSPTQADELAVNRAGLAEARRFASTRARRYGLTPDRLIDLELAVTELATNSVLHAGGTGTLRIWSDADYVICEIADTGQLSDPLAGRHPATPSQLNGRGLLLVNHLADLVRTHITPAGSTIRIHLRLPRARIRRVPPPNTGD